MATLQDAQDLQARVRQARAVLERMAGEARAIAQQGQQTQAEVARLKADQEVADKVTKLLTSIGEQRQNAAQTQLEGLVTRGLQTVFGDELSFHVVQEVRANRSEVDFLIRSPVNGATIETPVMDARGGGLAAVVGFLVRLVVMLLSATPATEHAAAAGARPTLFLDETFANVSQEYEPRLAEFIAEVVSNTDVQVVLITHSTAFSDYADRLYHFSLVDGETRVREGSSA